VKTGFWVEHWRRSPAVDRFLTIDAKDVKAVCPDREPIEALPSLENRIFRAGDLVVKFYRPGRWSKAAIEDEHQFLRDLGEAGLPAIWPVDLVDQAGLRIGIFEHIEGVERTKGIRESDAQVLGRTVARMHEVAEARDATARPVYSPRACGIENVAYLLGHGGLPTGYGLELLGAIEEIVDATEAKIAELPAHRLHGDLGLSSILWRPGGGGPVFLGFDDMLVGPAIHDIWMLGRKDQVDYLEALVAGYTAVRPLPGDVWALAPAMAALRRVWELAWRMSRLYDPVFRDNLPGFGTDFFWEEQLAYVRARVEEL